MINFINRITLRYFQGFCLKVLEDLFYRPDEAFCSLLVACYLSFVSRYFLFITLYFCSLHVTFSLLLVTSCLFLTMFCSLLITFCSLLVTFCSFLVTFCSLLVTFYLLLFQKFQRICFLVKLNKRFTILICTKNQLL